MWSPCSQASYNITATNRLQFVSHLIPLWISAIATYLHASGLSHCKLQPPRPNCTCKNLHTFACSAHLYPVHFSSSLTPTCPLSFLLPLNMSYHCLHLDERRCSRKIKKRVKKYLIQCTSLSEAEVEKEKPWPWWEAQGVLTLLWVLTLVCQYNYAVKCNRVFLSLCVYMCTICVFWVEEGIAN